MSNDDMHPTVADVHTDVGDNRPPRVLQAWALLAPKAEDVAFMKPNLP